MTEDSKDEYKEEQDKRDVRYKKSMLNAKLFAFNQRAESAGIPKRFVGIGPKPFSEYLCPKYHSVEERKKIINFIYGDPLGLNEKPFVVIDGGDIWTRKKAAFAIMFRLITCDNFAEFIDCRELVHKLNTFDPRDVKVGEGRNDYTKSVKEKNVICIGEFKRGLFSPHCEGGDFLDEILDYRFNKLNPTIVTFQEPIFKNNPADAICGQYMATMSKKEVLNENPSAKYLRIRVRMMDDE